MDTYSKEQVDAKFDALAATLRSIDAKLTPIADTYATVTSLGKWGMATLVSLSLVVGIIYALYEILTTIKR